jgi:hypothetical protein
MKTLAICAALSCVALCVAASRLTDDGLVVHEWGTFTSVADASGAPTDWNTLGCNSELPRFVKDYGFRGFKSALRGTVRMETPVIYFYSPHDLEASVKVSFPTGVITEWYPDADYQSGVIQWKSVKIRPGTRPEFPVEASPSRYYEARATDSAPLQVGDQHEKFLFYRGVSRTPVLLSARIAEDGRVTVTNSGTAGVPAVILFENRGGAIGYRNAGKVERGATLQRPSLNESSSRLKTELEGALIAQGLYPREAAAMIDTWGDSWFEEGSRLIYILPESAVNAMLPLEINPAPARVSRVFVGRIELITPETKRAVREAVAKGDAQTLGLYQRFLEPIGKSIGKTVHLPCAPAGQSQGH